MRFAASCWFQTSTPHNPGRSQNYTRSRNSRWETRWRREWRIPHRPRAAARRESHSTHMMPRALHNPIIVALDVESAAAARALVSRIGPRVNFYKVGLELYTAAGMETVRHLLGEGKQVFLDLKMYDIPETVARAVDLVALSGVRFLTVHAVTSVMRAAVAARAGSRLQILGVTVLTSFGPEDMDDLGYDGTVASLVERRARKAVEVGVDGDRKSAV